MRKNCYIQILRYCYIQVLSLREENSSSSPKAASLQRHAECQINSLMACLGAIRPNSFNNGVLSFFFFFFENNGVLSLQTTLEIRQMQVGDGASSSLSEKVISPLFLRWLPR